MNRAAVEHLLLSHLADTHRSDFFSYLTLTRRSFLAGGTLFAAPAAAKFHESATPRFAWLGRALRVSTGGSSWLIDPGAFVGSVQLELKMQQSEYVIELSGARFAGTAVRADMRARIYRAAREWRIALNAPWLALEGDLPLSQWFDGTEIERSSASRRLTIGGEKLRVSPGRRALSSRGGLTLTMSGNSIRLSGKIGCRGDALSLTCQGPAGQATSLAHLAGHGGRPTTRFEISNPKPAPRSSFALGHHGEYRPSHLTAVAGEAFEGLAGRNVALLVEGGGTLMVARAGGEWGNRLAFRRSALFLANGAASVAGMPVGRQLVRRAALSARLAQDGHEPIIAEFPSDGAPTLKGKLKLDKIWLPHADGERATVKFPASPASVPLGTNDSATRQFAAFQDSAVANPPSWDAVRVETSAAATPMGEPDAARSPRFNRVLDLPFSKEFLYDETEDKALDLETKAGPAADAGGIALDEARVILRRDSDLLNLEFRLIGFRLQGANGRPYLRRTATAKAARIIVEFQPQHIWETVHEKPTVCAAPTNPTQARLSRRSRLSFRPTDKDRPKDEAWRRRSLNVADLTDWSGLELIVDKRAAGALAERLDPQLKLPEICNTDWAIDLFRKVAGSFSPPDAETTALELAARLVFSPAEEIVKEDKRLGELVLWQLQQAGAKARGEPLWNVRLNDAGRKSVRAIWSSYLEKGRFYQQPRSHTRKLASDPPPLALTPVQHWDIVAQTSLYGLPALRRLEPTGDANDPVVTALKKIPRGGVIRPPGDPKYLVEIDGWQGYTNKDTGIALATPFDDADISLTALGGIFRARWDGEPAQLRPDITKTKGTNVPPEIKEIAPTGFSLEQLTYQTWLGRDIRVVAVTKGYLFPLGLRAAFVEIAERRFYPDPVPKANRAPVSFEVRRQFIRCRVDPKTFPALNQPYRSRDFPVQSVTMRTLLTPDLKTPDMSIGEALIKLHTDNPQPNVPPYPLPIDPNRRLFWPTIAGGDGSDFQFQWMTDSGAIVSSPLIFVESTYAGLERVMELLAKYYNTPQLVPRRTARFFGARQRYAPDNKQGDTSYDTDNWLLGARGQIFGEQGNSESFVTDGRMQGADQPPFYPVVVKAQVTIQSLDRLLGAPQGLISVAYHDKYRTLGFGDPKHPSDIYLRVLGPRIVLDVTRRSQTSGGLASPSALVAAISRQTGIVGGKDISTIDAVGAFDTAGAQMILASEYEGGFEFSQAELGKFDPIEYFGFKDAKLLGILDLKTVIRAAASLSAAPKLIETIGYGVLEDNEGLKRINKAASTARELTDKFFTALEALKNDIPRPLTLKDLYPDLVLAIDEARRVFDERFRAIENATNIASIGEDATKIISAARPLLREIDRLARDPIPPVAAAIVSQFKTYWSTVGSDLGKEWRVIAATLLDLLTKKLRDAICSLIDDPGDLEGVFFGASATVTCDDFLAKPDDLLANSSEALFREVFALPLSRMLTAAGDLEDVVNAQFAFPQVRIRADAQRLLEIATTSIAHRLAPYDPALRDIRDPAVQAATARAIAMAFAAKLQKDFKYGIGEIEKHFAVGLEVVLANQTNTLLDAIHPLLRPNPPLTPNPPQETAKQILADVEAQLLVLCRDAAIAVEDEAKKIRRLISEQAYALERQLIAMIGKALSDALAELLALAEFVRIAGLRTNRLCDSVYAAGHMLAVGVIENVSVLEQALDDYATKLRTLKFDALPAGTANAAEAIRSESLQMLASLRSEMSDFGKLVATIPAAGMGCAELPSLLDPARRVLLARNALLPRVAALADSLAKLRRLLENALKAELQVLAKDLAKLLGNITSIRKLETSGATTVDQVINLLKEGEDYRKELSRQLSAMRMLARSLRTAIDDPDLDSLLLPRLAADVQGYAEGFDRKIAALVLQSAALSDTTIDQWKKGIADAIRAAAGAVSTLHKLLRQAFDTLLSELEKKEAKPFVEFVLGIAAFDRLRDAIGTIRREDDLLAGIASPQTPDSTVIQEAQVLRDKWNGGGPAVVGAVTMVGGFVEDFLSGNLENSLAARIREALKAYARDLREMLSQFVPTRIETGYDWGAAIESGDIFKMSDRVPKPDDDDLTLSVKASIDIVKGTRELTTSGRLKPFELMLLPSAHMATIKFDALSFESRNGSSPEFNVKVADVKIGPLLKFLEPLKAFMAPNGNGFFLTPTFAPLGIEAGFQFGSALIQVGSLSFQNVFIRVSAWLPFGPEAAEFKFAFASDERPFLISSPPYGGGGYVMLTARPGGDNPTDLELSFVFGGVAAIKFGPLDAQGRVVAGIGRRTWKNGTTLWALFEAVGEGSIACFSVSVSLRVTVWHYSDGQMVGQTDFSFAFKLGFVEFSYRVTARYQLSGSGRNARRDFALASAATRSFGATLNESHYRVLAARKERNWAVYRRQIDSSLI